MSTADNAKAKIALQEISIDIVANLGARLKCMPPLDRFYACRRGSAGVFNGATEDLSADWHVDDRCVAVRRRPLGDAGDTIVDFGYLIDRTVFVANSVTLASLAYHQYEADCLAHQAARPRLGGPGGA